jgi:hypothetical protein
MCLHFPVCVQGTVIVFTVFVFVYLVTRYVMMQGQSSSCNIFMENEFTIALLTPLVSSKDVWFSQKAYIYCYCYCCCYYYYYYYYYYHNHYHNYHCPRPTGNVIQSLNAIELARPISCCRYVLLANRVCCVKTCRCECAS